MKIRTFRRRGQKLKHMLTALLRWGKKYKRGRKGGFDWKRSILYAGGGVLGLLFFYGLFFVPSVDDADQLAFAESTIIYDRGALDPANDPNEHILYVIHGDENREYIPLEEIPRHIIDATLAIEDDGFYRHFGFDIGGIIKGALNHFFGIGERRGGSTITQQLVKNTFLSHRAYERSISRKFKELILAVKVEWHYSKDEILELYLNNIPYGNNAHGIEAAAKTFFGKSARELTIAESAILVSLPAAPTRFSPYGSNRDLLMGYYEYNEDSGEREYKKGRKDLVLQRMLDLKKISFTEFKNAWAEANELEFKTYRIDIKAPHFVFYIRERLEEKYGKEFLKNGGLRIYTTLDPELQAIAEETIEVKTPHYPDTYGAKNLALTAINPDNGQILAYVGGKDYFDTENDGQVDVLTSRRQPGSSFKPYAYAAAFAQGYSPATVVFDVETDFGGNYQPQNFSGEFVGPVSLRDALNRSLNIPAIKVAFLARPANVLKVASLLGVKYDGNADMHGVAVGVGVAEVEPLSMINGYQAFTGEGSWYEPTGILEVRNSDGEILEQFDPERNAQIGLEPEVAALVRHILTDESTRPTTNDFDWNRLLQLDGFDNGSKTGTSNRMVENPEFDEDKPEDEEDNPKMITAPGDSWTIGFTPHLVSGVWVGNNRGEPMKPGATGLSVAAPVWKTFMTKAHTVLIEQGADPDKGYEDDAPETEMPTLTITTPAEGELESPSRYLTVRPVNRFSGKIASDLTPPKLVREEVFAPYAVPTELDDTVKMIEIDKISGRPATQFTPFYGRTRKYALTGLQSVRPDMPNWQNPVQEWLDTHPRFLTSLGTIMDEEPTDRQDLIRQRLSSRLIPSRSQQRDDVHNRFTSRNAPKIEIIAPRNGGILSPGQVEINVSVSSRYGMKAVEYYFDDKLIGDSVRFPWNGTFTLPESLEMGSKHTLRAVAIDRLFNSSEDQIEITIAADQSGPDIIFLGPVGKQRIPLGTQVHALVDVRDAASGVKVVEFFLDGQSLGFDEVVPYEKDFRATGRLGEHELGIKAWDFYGNVSERKLPIIYERQRLSRSTIPEIVDIVSYRNSISVDTVFPEPEKIEWAELIAEQGDQIIWSRRLDTVTSYAQFQIPRNNAGRTTLRLITKYHGIDAHQQSPLKTTKL